MAKISITDALQAEVLSANPQINGGFGRYLKNTPAALLAGTDFVTQFTKDLVLVNPGESGFGMSFSQPLSLGDGKPSLSIAAGAKASLGVYNRTGMLLFEQTFIGTPAKVGPGQAVVAFAFRPSLSIGIEASAGSLGFGFEAGTEAEIRCYRPFDVTTGETKLGAALKQLLENYTFLGTALDLENMQGLPEGSIATVSGKGSLALNTSVDFAAAFNPLAAVNTLPKVGKVTVGGGASLKAGCAVEVFGEFQIRAQKLNGNLLRLSYHKTHGGELTFSMSASAGPNVTVGDKELLAMLFTGDPRLSGGDETAFVAAGISKAQLNSLRASMRSGLSRKLNLEMAAQFSSLKQHDAAFEYEIDLSALDQTGRHALDEALAGNLTELNALEGQPAAHGIRVTQSLLETLRQKTVRWRINLLGIVNVLSLSELVRTGSVFHDNDSGELVIADEASTKRMGAVVANRNVRKLLNESAILTATYKAAGVDVNQDLEASQSFFLFDKNANRQRVADFLDAVAGAGLMDPADIATTLDGIDDFGAASLLLETSFDQVACEKLFLNNGAPKTREFYEEVGKQALLALVSERDPDAYRRIPMLRGDLWKSMRSAGQPNFRFVLPAPITGGGGEGTRVARVAADYSLIVWWSETMAEAASHLADMRLFLNGRDATGLEQDATFQSKRKDLADALAKSIQKNKSNFDDPWGLLALYAATGRTGEVTAQVVSPKLTLSLP